MRRYWMMSCLAAILPLHLVAQTPAPTTTTIYLDWSHLQRGACGAYPLGQVDVPFVDTAGSDWTNLTVRMQLQAGPSQAGMPMIVPTVSIAINGVPIGDSVAVPNRAGCWINLQTFEFQTASLPGYRASGSNTFSVFVNGWHAGGPPAELTFTTPPATFTFEYPEGQPSQQMLIHKYRTQGGYPSRYQVPTSESERPRFRLPGVVKVNGVGASRAVWFRVVDPRDSSAYIPPADRVPNDNKDRQPKGILMPPGCSSIVCGASPGAPLMVRSPASGVTEVTLEGTDRYAGDNYQVEASLDAAFTCTTAGQDGGDVCPKSAMVTAWKRIYVEKKNMFRRGAYVVAEALAGDVRLAVSDPAPFTPGQVVRLIHGPRLQRVVDPSAPIPSVPVDFFVTEDNVVDHVEVSTVPGQPSYLHLRNAIGTNFGPDLSFLPSGSQGAQGNSYLRDAVGVVTGASFSDYFVANPAYLNTLFDSAFVEYVDAPQLITAVPYEQRMPMMTAIRLAQKWYENSVRGMQVTIDDLPNHRQLIGGSRVDDNQNTRGARFGATFGGGHNPSWVYVDRIEAAVHEPNQPVFALDADRVTGEVTTHELVHQWNANPVTQLGATQGHCLETDYLGNAFCLLHSPFYDPNHNAEFGDGIVLLHYKTPPNGGVDSEYVTIRTAAEPLPQH